MNDTIAAISTALGVGAISIIRVSGVDSIKIVNSIFFGTNLLKVKTHTIHYGYIKDGNKKIDEVLVSVMKAPKTFTTEDVVEINCHGGIATTKKVLELVLSSGARLAEPGEFSKRAYLNGRIDLVEASGIMDLINAETEEKRKLAMSELTGNVSNMIHNLRTSIADILTNIEVNVDYPEYDDVQVITDTILLPKLKEVEKSISKIIEESNEGRLVSEGISTVILGRPNVGKSSLLNCLLNENKAIVTDVAGTTRDIVEGKIVLDGVILNIIDTAGLRITKNKVEKIGVAKSLEVSKKADLVLYVLNNNEPLTKYDLSMLDKIKDKNTIIVINKIDLDNKLDIKKLKDYNIVSISAITNTGIEDLKKSIIKLFDLEKIKTSDMTYLTNAESISKLKICLKDIKNVYKSVKAGVPLDIISIDIRDIWELLGSITGESYSDELIDQMFSRFCLGK
jgi:tRNA modification GTPase